MNGVRRTRTKGYERTENQSCEIQRIVIILVNYTDLVSSSTNIGAGSERKFTEQTTKHTSMHRQQKKNECDECARSHSYTHTRTDTQVGTQQACDVWCIPLCVT